MEHCKICDRTFANNHSLRTHRSRFHGPNQKNEFIDTRINTLSKSLGSENHEHEKDSSRYSSSSDDDSDVPEEDALWSRSDDLST